MADDGPAGELEESVPGMLVFSFSCQGQEIHTLVPLVLADHVSNNIIQSVRVK